jgi:predicted nucleotidyltransferase component of viral defense system
MLVEYLQYELLDSLFKNAVAAELNFIGGTAIRILHDSPRFSEDLDFDLNTESIAEVREKCKEIASKIEGYEINEYRKVGKTIQFYCNYESVLEGKDHVRVDVAAKRIITKIPPLIKPAQSTYTQRFVTGFYVYAIEDLVARKLHALQTRTEGKDIHDSYNALPLCENMEVAIEKMLESEKSEESMEEFIGKAIIAVKKQDAKKIRNLTNPFIPVNNRPKDWNQLKNALVLLLENL